ADDSYERDVFKDFQREIKTEDKRPPRGNDQVLFYYAPIRAGAQCIACHNKLQQEGQDPIAVNDLMAMVRIRMPTKSIEEGVHWNRALLITTAIGTAILIMVASWII